MKKICLLFFIVLFSVISYSQSIFLEIKNLPGDTPDGQPVLAYSWGASNSGSSHVGGGMGSGKANIQDLSFTMQAGKYSMELLKSVVMGMHFPEIKLKIMDNKKVIYTITLEDVMATSYQQGASCGNNHCEKPAESVTLSFARFKIEDHKSSTSFTYNVAANTQN